MHKEPSVRLWPTGTVSPNGWTLSRIRKPHPCAVADCPTLIRPPRAAWTRLRAGRGARTMLYLCQHGHREITGMPE